MLPRTVFQGNSAKCWNTMPRSGPGPATGLPSTRIAAGFDRQKAADQIEQRRLAAAGRPEQRDEFAVGDLERDLVERQHLAPARRAVDVADAVDDDLGGCGHGGLKPRRWPLYVKRQGCCFGARTLPIMRDTQPTMLKEDTSVPKPCRIPP